MKGILFGASLSLAALAITTASASAQDRRVEIVNDTSFIIMEFYASNVDAATWEEDILGQNVLDSGQSVVVNVDDGSGYCLYDFRAVFNDGDEVTKAGVNVCEIGRFTFN